VLHWSACYLISLNIFVECRTESHVSLINPLKLWHSSSIFKIIVTIILLMKIDLNLFSKCFLSFISEKCFFLLMSDSVVVLFQDL
jgi:hypothetical protein